MFWWIAVWTTTFNVSVPTISFICDPDLLLQSGGDIHVAVDGNFHHRHVARSGDVVKWCQSKYILPKVYVDGVGEEIDKARKISRMYVPKVPESAVENCKSSYHAANGDEETNANIHFDDNGLFVCQCRHGIPLFLVNMDSPGEQQKYVIAVLRSLFLMLPPEATVVLFYDIACVVEQSVQKVVNSLCPHYF